MYTKASLITFFASLAAAQIHPPVGQPTGNPILRPLNEIVPTCESFAITWQPTTPNTVSVLLLKGPATNVVKFGPSLAEGIPNSGSLSWTPSSDLEATEGPNGYGLQIVDDVTGEYQYSTQFGISVGDCDVVSSSSVAPASSTGANGYSVSPVATSTPKPSSVKGYATIAPYPTSLVTKSSQGVICSTGLPYANGTGAVPTGYKPAPSATANATTSRLPESTGAASTLQAGLGFAGALAAFAFML